MKAKSKFKRDREPFWDSLKFLLIFLVVYGHMIETYVDNSRFNQAMYNFIYLFHMPLFVFISGHFSHIKNKRKYLLRMISLYETFFIFQFARCLKPLFAGESLRLFPDIIIPKGILWYLACLLLWRLIIIIAKVSWLKRNKWVVLLSFLLLGICIGFVMVHDGTIISFFSLGLFFFMGYYMKDSHLESFFQKIPVWLTFPLLICLWFLVYFYLNLDIRSVIYFGCYYDNYPISPLNYFGARIFLYIFAIIAGSLLMRIVYTKPLFSSYGAYTLVIFMYHTSILRLILINGSTPSNEPLLLVISIITCFFLAWVTQQFKIMTIMLNPITFILNKYKTGFK